MASFKRDLWDVVNKIKFRKVSYNFQNQLKKDIKALKRSKKPLVSADKTLNIYQIEKDEYSKLTIKQLCQTTKRFVTKLAAKFIQMERK